MAKRNVKKLIDELNVIFNENGQKTTVKRLDDYSFIITVNDYSLENVQYAQLVTEMFLTGRNLKINNYGLLGNMLIYKI